MVDETWLLRLRPTSLGLLVLLGLLLPWVRSLWFELREIGAEILLNWIDKSVFGVGLAHFLLELMVVE